MAEQLANRGVEPTGPAERLHDRVWSSAARFHTTDGPVWLKVNGAGTAHEPALLALLQARSPGLSPDVLAVDVPRRWSLCRDAGPMLREVAAPRDQWLLWERLVVRYAELQIQLAGDREEVLAAGVREVSPRTIPGLARELVASVGSSDPSIGGLTGPEVEALHAELPRLDGWCAELAASGVPDSVQHDDLHSGNVCWPGTGPVLRVRDAFLEPFTAYAGRRDLVRCADLAQRVGCVSGRPCPGGPRC